MLHGNQLASLHAFDSDSDVVQLDRFWLRVADRCGDGGQRSCFEVQCRSGLTLSHFVMSNCVLMDQAWPREDKLDSHKCSDTVVAK